MMTFRTVQTATMHLVLNLMFILPLFQHALAQSPDDEQSILYFAYGNNLLDLNIHIRNPAAVFHSTAELKGYRLDFTPYVTIWRGAAATIAKDPTSSVWGALWIIKKNDMKRLDDQEGVNLALYVPINVTVTTPIGQKLFARTHKVPDDPAKLKEGETLPPSRRPSTTYLQVITYGAYKAGLPSEYMEYLKTIPANGNFADDATRYTLGYPFIA